MDRVIRVERANRHQVNIAATLLLATGVARDVTVENLSLDGACVRSWLQPGDAVLIMLPRIGSFDAAVRWARGGRAGLKFARRRRSTASRSATATSDFNGAESRFTACSSAERPLGALPCWTKPTPPLAP